MAASKLRVFTFSPRWGLPTSGPFGLKLEVCLRMMGLDYERVFEDDPRKGPKRKSPWIEDGAVRLGDTELILEYLHDRYGVTLDEGLDARARARGLVLRRMLEEHFHQVFEYELCVLDAGWAELRPALAAQVPWPARAVVEPLLRRKVRRHLFERGIARHTPAEIERMGRDDLDAVATLLGDRDFLLGDEPTKTDATAFGLLATTLLSSLPTPVCSYARTLPSLVAYVRRMGGRFFPELGAAGPGVIPEPAAAR